MKPSFWITLAVSVSLCIVALVAQAARNKNLAKSLADEQAEAAQDGKQEPAMPAEPMKSAASDEVPSAERFDLARETLEGLAALGNDESALMKRMPDFLRAAQGLSVEDLIALAGSLPRSRAKSYLVMLAAEQDPRRVYEDEALTEGMPATWRLALLGRRDPASALAEIPPLKPRPGSSERDRSGLLLTEPDLAGRVHYATKLLGVDLVQGLAALREVHEVEDSVPIGVMLSMGIPSLPEGTIPGLVDAMDRPENAELRDDILKMTVTQSLFDGGVVKVARLVDSMDLTPEEMKQAVARCMKLAAVESEPAAMVDWLAEVQPDGVPDALIEWADQDLQGATDWLGEQEPSPVRDQAIAKFIAKARRVDPDAAAQWAREIQDEKLRKQTLRRVGIK